MTNNVKNGSMAVGICYALYARLRKGESMRAIRAIAVLLCAALLLPVCGCTEREPDMFMSVEKIAERYPGVECVSGYNTTPIFVVSLTQTPSLEWVKHLTKATSVQIIFASYTNNTLTLPDISLCKELESLTFIAEATRPNYPYGISKVGMPGGLDLSSLAGSKVSYLGLVGLKDKPIELGDGVETMSFEGTTPDMEKLAAMPNLRELRLLLGEPCDLTPLAKSESLHLLHLGMYDVPRPEWDLSPLKGSKVDTLLLGAKLPLELLEPLAGAENIRHLQINKTESMAEPPYLKGIETLSSFPNLETVGIFGLSPVRKTKATFVDSKKEKKAVEYIVSPFFKDATAILQELVDREVRLMGWTNNGEDRVQYTTIGAKGTVATDNYYEWYYANVG